MASTKNRGLTAREAVLTYCTFWTQALYRHCWPKPHEVNPDATTEEKKAACLLVDCEVMAMLRHEIPEQDDTASASEPMREPTVLEITGDLGSDSEPEIIAGSFLGTYGVLDIDTVGHWTYRAGEARLREITENGPDWFAHYDRFFVTHKDGFVQMLTISLCRRRDAGVEKTKASATVGDRAPGGTFGNNEPDLRLATARDIASKLPDPNQFDEPAPVPLWVEGKPDDGMPRRGVTQDELRHLRLYPERDELSGGGLRFEGLLFFNAAERLPVDETKEAGVEVKIEHGRPSRKDDIENAYSHLADAGKINFDKPRTETYNSIRQEVRKALGVTTTNEVAGLGDETIRQVIATLFDRDKAARPPSNKLSNKLSN